MQVGNEHLQELRGLTAQDPLPAWAQQIDVATEDPETHGGSIQNNVRAFTGQQLKHRGGNLAMATILDGIVEKKSMYEVLAPRCVRLSGDSVARVISCPLMKLETPSSWTLSST